LPIDNKIRRKLKKQINWKTSRNFLSSMICLTVQ
jgi:hypothetical protein